MPQGNLASVSAIKLAISDAFMELEAAFRAVEEGVSFGEPQRAQRLASLIQQLTAELHVIVEGDE